MRTPEVRRRDDGRPALGSAPAIVFAGLARGAATFAVLLPAAGIVAAVVGTAATESPAVPGIANPGAVIEFGIPIARVLLDLGAAAATGLALLPKLLGGAQRGSTEAVVRSACRRAVWASSVWAAASLVSIILQTAELGVAPTPRAVWTYLVDIAAGRGLLLSAGCAVVSLWICLLSTGQRRNVPPELRIAIALFGLLPLALTGHSADQRYHDFAMIFLELHVVAASAWAGGLGAVVVFLARRPQLLAIALPRFSRLATGCVLVVGVTGIFSGLLELGSVSHLPESLIDTRYGVLLLAKFGCLAVIAVIAVNVRTRILPRVVAQQRTSLALWCGWELLVLAVAFGVAVALSRTPVTVF